MRSDFWEDRAEMLRFALALIDGERIESAKAAVEFFEKPWKWETEYLFWVADGRPDSYAEP